MKILGNSWVSGTLAVIAVAFFVYQWLQPRWAQGAAANARELVPVTELPQVSAPRAAQPPAAPAPALPTRGIDRQYAESHAAEWADSPPRDPFLLIPVVVKKPVQPEPPVHQYPSPVIRWKLTAIWRQTGGRVAAINNRVYSEGESIDGYRIEQIDADQVWFQGPDRMERLGLDWAGTPGQPGPSGVQPGKPPGTRAPGDAARPRS
jgi:hypothetical protein